jgi:hypothetical protein
LQLDFSLIVPLHLTPKVPGQADMFFSSPEAGGALAYIGKRKSTGREGEADIFV